MRKIWVILLAAMLLASCVGVADADDYLGNDVPIAQNRQTLDAVPVTRAMVAKMLSLISDDVAGIQARDSTIDFADVDEDIWFYKYVNAAVAQGYMRGTGTTDFYAENFMPKDTLTVMQAQYILDAIVPDNTTRIQITDENRNQPISYALWVELYMRALNELAEEYTLAEAFSMEEVSLVVLATSAQNSRLPQWSIATDRGLYFFEGMNMEQYVDVGVRALVKGTHVVALISENDTPTLHNVYVEAIDADSVKIFVGGVWRVYRNEIGAAAADISSTIADVSINNGAVTGISSSGEENLGVIANAASGYVEISGFGRFEMHPQFGVYAIESGIARWMSVDDLRHSAEVLFVVRDDIARAVVLQ